MKPFQKKTNTHSTEGVTRTRNKTALAWQAAVAALFTLLLMQSFFNFAVGLLMGVVLLSSMLVFGLVYQRRTKVILPGKGLLLAGLLMSLAMLAGLTWVHLAPTPPGERIIFGFNLGFLGTMTLLGAMAARSFNKLDRNEAG